MTIVTGDRYLDLLSTFIEDNTGPLLDGVLLLKLNPVGLHYVQARLEALEELEALRVGAPVDYLRAYVADLGDHRALEQLRRVLRLLSSVKVVAMAPPPFTRDPTPITLLPFSSLRFLELRGCDLSTTAARGLLELRPILEKLVCFNSADALRHIFSERTKEIQGAPVWSRLADVSCFGNGMMLMDESLQLLPGVEALDLSRNRFAKLANLQKCTKLKYLDAGYNNITTVASLNKILLSVIKLVLRNNALVSTRGLHRIASLEALDLSYNLISNFREVELLGELPSLRFLWLEGNPITFGRWYRREVLSYFPDPMKLVLDGKQTSVWESWAARRIVARRLKQRSKYGAFTPAQTCESSDLSPQLSDIENVDDTTNRVESKANAGPSSASSAFSARKKNSRVASIIDVTGMKGVSRTRESPRGSPSNPSASLDSASPVQSAGESKEQMEETVQDLIQRAEVLKKSGAACWLKDLNALLENEGKGKPQTLAKVETSRQSSLLKRRRRRSIRKESFGEPSTSDRINMSEEYEKLEKNVARLTTERSAGRMGEDDLARLGSGYFVDDEAANLSTSTSLEDLQRPFADCADHPPSSVVIPDHPDDGVGLKLDEPSGKYRLAEELLTGKMSVGSSSSPPQFNQALLRRREILERELLLLPPDRDIPPFSDSDTSSGTIYSHLSDSSNSPIHSPSAVWHPYRFDRGQSNEIPSVQGESSDIDDTFQAWSDTETQEGEALERGGSDVKGSTDMVHTDEVAQHSGKATAPTEYTAEGNEPPIEGTIASVHPTASKEPVVEDVVSEQGTDPVEDDTTIVIDNRGQNKTGEARSGHCEISSSSMKDSPKFGSPDKEKGGGDQEQLNLGRTSMLEFKRKSSRRIVHLESLSGIRESSGEFGPSVRGGIGSGNELHRSTSFGVNRSPRKGSERSVSSSVQFSRTFNISRSSSVDANLERQREWSRSRSQEDALSSTSLQQGESHEATDNSLQFHRVHHVVGPFVGQCV